MRWCEIGMSFKRLVSSYDMYHRRYRLLQTFIWLRHFFLLTCFTGFAYVTPEKTMKAKNSGSFTNYILMPVTPPSGVYKPSGIIETPNINTSESHGVSRIIKEAIRERQQLPDFHRKTRMFHVAALVLFYDMGAFIYTLLWKPHDSRTIDWFLVRNPIYLVIIMMAYHYFIQYLGPKFMKDRNPLDLSRLIMIFNVTQIVYNVWMFNELLQAGWWGSYNLLCQPVDYSSSPQALRMANVCWHYYMSKIIDLLDTIFFVLRKKNNQITPLHLLHHTAMPVASFGCVRFYPGGHITLTGLLNSFIHSIMYFYYLLAGLGPSFKKYLWWKQYLTLLQMTQFLIISIHSSFIFLFDCDFDKLPMFYLMVNSLLIFMLFSSFYRQTYLKKTS